MTSPLKYPLEIPGVSGEAGEGNNSLRVLYDGIVQETNGGAGGDKEAHRTSAGTYSTRSR